MKIKSLGFFIALCLSTIFWSSGFSQPLSLPELAKQYFPECPAFILDKSFQHSTILWQFLFVNQIIVQPTAELVDKAVFNVENFEDDQPLKQLDNNLHKMSLLLGEACGHTPQDEQALRFAELVIEVILALRDYIGHFLVAQHGKAGTHYKKLIDSPTSYKFPGHRAQAKFFYFLTEIFNILNEAFTKICLLEFTIVESDGECSDSDDDEATRPSLSGPPTRLERLLRLHPGCLRRWRRWDHWRSLCLWLLQCLSKPFRSREQEGESQKQDLLDF